MPRSHSITVFLLKERFDNKKSLVGNHELKHITNA